MIHLLIQIYIGCEIIWISLNNTRMTNVYLVTIVFIDGLPDNVILFIYRPIQSEEEILNLKDSPYKIHFSLILYIGEQLRINKNKMLYSIIFQG